MDIGNAVWTAKFDSWSAKKSDEQLAEIVQKTERKDIDYEIALQVLHDRLQPKLLRYLSWLASTKGWNKNWIDIEDVAQEAWMSFILCIEIEEVRFVWAFMKTIAKRRLIDTLRTNGIERTIEFDKLIGNAEVREEREPEIPFEEEASATETQMRFLAEFPYTTHLLSDCQRVFWIMREHFGYSNRIISRLTGKTEHVVYQTLSQARRKIRRFMQSREYDLWVANRAMEDRTDPRRVAIPDTLVERFVNPLRPELTADEIKDLEFSGEEDFRVHGFVDRSGVQRWFPSLLLFPQVKKVGLSVVYLEHEHPSDNPWERIRKGIDHEQLWYEEICEMEIVDDNIRLAVNGGGFFISPEKLDQAATDCYFRSKGGSLINHSLKRRNSPIPADFKYEWRSPNPLGKDMPPMMDKWYLL